LNRTLLGVLVRPATWIRTISIRLIGYLAGVLFRALSIAMLSELDSSTFRTHQIISTIDILN
jgi:hypothetical protein